ncbi:MAG: glycosyltransferase family 2 protein [Methanomassiliicoccales archaeon]|nr:MAG: glycosyltransferase family 2 protein [Methanomassiliicoccales archaeon]
MRCSTIVLIYNEEENIEKQVREILNAYKECGIDGEILLVDDGSVDGSGSICDQLTETYPMVRTVHHTQNKGRSWAIETGFKNARGEVFIIMDGDCQYEPREIPSFLQKIGEGYDVVSGYRYDRTDTWIRRFISRVYNKVIVRGFLGLHIGDQNSGFKAFTKEVALGMGFDPEGYWGLHRFILPLAHLKGFSITEIDIKHYPRSGGKSYIKPHTVIFITLRDFIRFRKEHMRRYPKGVS